MHLEKPRTLIRHARLNSPHRQPCGSEQEHQFSEVPDAYTVPGYTCVILESYFSEEQQCHNEIT
jgi:hypothetical protein